MPARACVSVCVRACVQKCFARSTKHTQTTPTLVKSNVSSRTLKQLSFLKYADDDACSTSSSTTATKNICFQNGDCFRALCNVQSRLLFGCCCRLSDVVAARPALFSLGCLAAKAKLARALCACLRVCVTCALDCEAHRQQCSCLCVVRGRPRTCAKSVARVCARAMSVTARSMRFERFALAHAGVCIEAIRSVVRPRAVTESEAGDQDCRVSTHACDAPRAERRRLAWLQSFWRVLLAHARV